MTRPELVLIYEAEMACRSRLVAAGFARDHAAEISSYLAQSTDLAREFDAIAEACERRGIVFAPLELDRATDMLVPARDRKKLVLTLTDGIAYFRGGAALALARLHGLPTIGSDDTLLALCQDKFRSGAVLRALGLPVPAAGLARDGEWIVPPRASRPTAWRSTARQVRRRRPKIAITSRNSCRSRSCSQRPIPQFALSQAS